MFKIKSDSICGQCKNPDRYCQECIDQDIDDKDVFQNLGDKHCYMFMHDQGECGCMCEVIKISQQEERSHSAEETRPVGETNKQMAAISAAEKWVINRDIPPTGFDSFMAGVEWQKQHH